MADVTKGIVSSLSENVYISIDLDGSTRGSCPPSSRPTRRALLVRGDRHISGRDANRNIVGFDVMELAPIAGMAAPDYLAARLCYRLMGWLVAPVRRKENPRMSVPKKIFFTKGVGRHREELHSFELALRDAGIQKFNLVQVSSIFPPKCRIVKKEKGSSSSPRGDRLLRHEPMLQRRTDGARRLRRVRAPRGPVGVRIPQRTPRLRADREGGGDYAEDLAAAMLASTLGMEFDVDKSWDENKEIFKISGKIVRTRNVTQSVIVPRNGGLDNSRCGRRFRLLRRIGKPLSFRYIANSP